MESWKQKNKLYDDFRKSWVTATPEEVVRQTLLQKMMKHLGYPQSLLSVEKQLSLFPHLQDIKNLPQRRADIVCFGKGIHADYPLYPLLLIECKEVVEEDAKQQALGYNHFLQAFYVAVAGKDHLELVYPYALSFLPSYSQLLEGICK